MKISKYLYVIGGCALSTERQPIDSIERISITDGGEQKINIESKICGQLSHAKRSPSVFVKDENTIIIAGGCLGPNNHSNEIEILQKSQDSSWTSQISGNSKCEVGHSCAAFHSKSKTPVIFGGFEAHNCLESVQVQNEAGDFRKIKGFLPKLKNSVALEIRDEFLLFGGYQDEKETTAAIRRIKFNPSFTEYSIEFDGLLPYPVEGHSLAENDEYIYLIGGFDGCFVIPSIIRYSLKTKKSEILDTKLSEKRENHVSGIVGGKYLIVAGGWDSKKALDSIEVFEVLDSGDLRKIGEGKLETPRNRPSSVCL
ncbi:unnamed protein product [Caenorhabditis angaria]|uniref:Uncharacterized protein n=1 Tax=Caenorhabditis angaria TaxID=860376 RepID=A0A9P1I4F5_9PELO|nr:unnamed protein product [Caenorhabditis angaria]